MPITPVTINASTITTLSPAATAATIRQGIQAVSFVATPAPNGSQVLKTVTGQVFPRLQ